MTEATLQTKIIRSIDGACLSIDDLISLLDQPRNKILRSLSGLVLRGFVERREQGCYSASLTGLAHVQAHGFVTLGGPGTKIKRRAAVKGTLRQRAWNAMRIQSPFTVRGIAALASLDTPDAERGLHKWFIALELAGYLQRDMRREPPQRPGSYGLLRYRLVKNTGMSAPIYSVRHGLIRDPNTGEDTPCKR